MSKTVDIPYDELIEDYHKVVYMRNKELPESRVSIRGNEDLTQLADDVIDSMRRLRVGDVKYSSIRFMDLEDNVAGRHLGNGLIGIDDCYDGTQDPYLLIIVPHEIYHSSGLKSEAIAEYHTLDFCAQMGLAGDKRFEIAAYDLLERMIRDSMELKARKNGVPKKLEQKVHEILGEPKKKNSRIKVFFGKDKQIHSPKIDIDLFEYSYLPWSKVKDAIRNGKNSTDIYGTPLKVDNIKRFCETML